MTVDELLAQYTLPDDERKRLMMGNALLGLGMGLASSRRGNELSGLTQGLFAGTQAGAQQYGDAQRGQVDRLKMREHLQGVIDKQEAAKKAAADQAEIGKVFAGGPQLQNMGAGGPTPQNAAAVAPPNKIEQYRQAAALYASKGNVEYAAKLSAIADKMEQDYSTTPQTVRGPDGKLQLVQFGNRGGTKVAEGMTPAEKLHFANTGGMAGVGIDQYSGAQVSQGLPVTMDPAQADASKRGWAQYQLSKNADQRAATTATQAKEVKPQWDSPSGSFVYPPSADAPQGKAVQPQGYQAKPPEHTRRELDSINAQLGTIEGARKAAEATPSAFGMTRGAATLGGSVTESLAGRMDSPDERNARSYVYNIVSAAINERAGAAQSVQELARLRSFLPGELDNAKQISDKLLAFETYLKDKRKAYIGAGRTQGGTVDFSALPQ